MHQNALSIQVELALLSCRVFGTSTACLRRLQADEVFDTAILDGSGVEPSITGVLLMFKKKNKCMFNNPMPRDVEASMATVGLTRATRVASQEVKRQQVGKWRSLMIS